MQNKTIRKVLKAKIDDWTSTIDDANLVRVIKRDVIVTGGSIASMIMGDKINDFDVYFKTKETTLKVAHYYVNKFNQNKLDGPSPEVREVKKTNIKGKEEDRVVIWVSSAGVAESEDFKTEEDHDGTENDPDQVVEDDDGERYRPVFLSENAVTLSHKMQIVIRFYGTPDEIHDNYDFVHAKCYWTYHEDKLVTPVEALRSMQSKVLKYEGSLYPICSVFRCRKFISRGWKISAGEMLKMCLQISEIDLKNPTVLREQTTGIDAAYFHMLLSAIDSGREVDSAYLITIIDRIFSQE